MEQQQQQPTASQAEEGETEPRGWPQIYVACLAAYNNGRLHGTWLDAAIDVEELHDRVQLMLAASPIRGAEEFAIHDYEGFGAFSIGEYESLGVVSRVGLGIAEHGLAFAAWASHIGTDPGELKRFEYVYQGHWDSLEQYAEQMLEDFGAAGELEGLPEWLLPYVKLDALGFAHDLEASGHIVIVGDQSGGGHVFDTSH